MTYLTRRGRSPHGKVLLDRRGFLKHPNHYQYWTHRHRVSVIEVGNRKKVSRITCSVQRAKNSDLNYILPLTVDDLIEVLASFRDEHKAGKALVQFPDCLPLLAVHLNPNGKKTVILTDQYGDEPYEPSGKNGDYRTIFR